MDSKYRVSHTPQNRTWLVGLEKAGIVLLFLVSVGWAFLFYWISNFSRLVPDAQHRYPLYRHSDLIFVHPFLGRFYESAGPLWIVLIVAIYIVNMFTKLISWRDLSR